MKYTKIQSYMADSNKMVVLYNEITGYISISLAELKGLIQEGKVEVTNLKFSKNGSLIEDRSDTESRIDYTVDNAVITPYDPLVRYLSRSDFDAIIRYGEIPYHTEKIIKFKSSKSIIDRAKALNKEIREIMDGIYLIDGGDSYVIVCKDRLKLSVGNYFNSDAQYMAYRSRCRIDLSGIDMSDMVASTNMFRKITLGKLIIQNMNMDKLKHCIEAFDHTIFGGLYIENLQLSSLQDITDLFSNITVKELMIGNLQLPELVYAKGLFRNANIEKLVINNINAPKLMDISGMFENAIIKNLDINNLVVSNIQDTSKMFYGAKINNKLDLRFIGNKVNNATAMFKGAEIPGVDLSNTSIGTIRYNTDMFNTIGIHDINVICNIRKTANTSDKIRDIENENKRKAREVSKVAEKYVDITHSLIMDIHSKFCNDRSIKLDCADYCSESGRVNIAVSKYSISFKQVASSTLKELKAKGIELMKLRQNIYLHVNGYQLTVISDRKFYLSEDGYTTHRQFDDTYFYSIDLTNVNIHNNSDDSTVGLLCGVNAHMVKLGEMRGIEKFRCIDLASESYIDMFDISELSVRMGVSMRFTGIIMKLHGKDKLSNDIVVNKVAKGKGYRYGRILFEIV